MSTLSAIVPAVATVALVSDAAVAQTVGLRRAGPVDPVTGWPLFYEDANGLRLGLCQDLTRCFFFPPDPVAPVHFPTSANDPAANYPDELFYWAADCGINGGGGARVLVRHALEAAFFNGPVAIGDNIVFSRLRIRITGLVDGASYRVTHPYGQTTLIAGVDGPLPGTINVTEDLGISAPGVFDGVLAGNVGPFLTPVDFIGPGFPGQFVADGSTEVLVQGSPFGTNFVRIEGPSIDALFPTNATGVGRIQINTFVIQGQVSTSAGAGVKKAAFRTGAGGNSLDVWAQSATGQSLAASLPGGVPVTMTEGIDGNYFARIDLGASTARPGSVSLTNNTDFPPTAFTSALVADQVAIQSAVFTLGGDLAVEATSSDKLNSPVLTAFVDGFSPAVLSPLGGGAFAGNCGLPAGAVPPTSVRVQSSSGGVAVADIQVAGAAAPGGGGGGGGGNPPLVANAGPDVTVSPGANVGLSGLASSGAILTWTWTHDAGAAIALLGADTPTPSFVAPAVAVNSELLINFTLTVTDSLGSSSDTVIVRVLGPTGPVNAVAIADARFIVNKQQWRAAGNNTIGGGTVTAYVGSIGDRSRPIGTVPVSALGAWNLLLAATAANVPLLADTTIWAEASAGGAASRTFRRQ